MMTACDLSAITKPWEVQSKVGDVSWRITSLLLLWNIQSMISPILGCPLCSSWILGAGWSWEDCSWATAHCEYLFVFTQNLPCYYWWLFYYESGHLGNIWGKKKRIIWKVYEVSVFSLNLAHDGQEQSCRAAKASVWFYRLCLYFCLQGTFMN